MHLYIFASVLYALRDMKPSKSPSNRSSIISCSPLPSVYPRNALTNINAPTNPTFPLKNAFLASKKNGVRLTIITPK